jgi:hypothetical protein
VQWFLKAHPGYDENNGIELWAVYSQAVNELTVVYGRMARLVKAKKGQ